MKTFARTSTIVAALAFLVTPLHAQQDRTRQNESGTSESGTGESRTGESRTGQRKGRIQPTHADVQYGPHQRNVMDVWLADSQTPTPVLVSIHGGGFRGGNKSVSQKLLSDCLESKISVVAITYRLSGDAIAPAQFHDSARAIQFVRHNADKWNLDKERIASTGGSAGAGLSMWLAFHDDMADSKNSDPVLRHSTRLTCAAVYNGQTSYDPRVIRKLIHENDTYKHAALAQLYDADLSKLDELPAEKYQLFEEVSAINHLSKDDVPVLLSYASEMQTPITNHGIGIHHPRFGKMLKEKMDELGIECTVRPGVPRQSNEEARQTFEFVKRHFGLE
jgi:acetyl esterase/lipase